MKKIIIFIGFCLIVSGAWLLSGYLAEKNIIPPQAVEQGRAGLEEAKETKKEVNLAIKGIWEEKKVFTAAIQEPMTALALLENGAKELGLGLKIKTSDIGTLVEAIGGKENGEDGKYWLYYVNGKMPMMAVDKYLLNPGDTMEFKFEKSPF